MKADYLKDKFYRYLERHTPPAFLKTDQSRVDEMDALLRAVLRIAPDQNFQEWWPRFEDNLDRSLKTRAWPTVFEINKAAPDNRPIAGEEKVGEEWEPDTLKIQSDRIKSGKLVADTWIFGRAAVELVQSGYVTEEDLKPYRSGSFFRMKSVQGEEFARKVERDMRDRHDAAREAAGMAPIFRAGVA